MSKKILITGATGLIGRALSNALIKRGDEVIAVSRSAEKTKSILPNAANCIEWDFKNEFQNTAGFENLSAVIHLAGENVMAKRWGDEHKKKILESRIDSTKMLVNLFRQLQNKPKVFVCASAVGYYGSSDTEEFTEESEPGSGFLADVTKKWENEAAKADEMNIRRVSVRTGIVLSNKGGAFKKMITPFKLFVGGPLGSGKQWFPWIHIDDLVGLFIFAIDNQNVIGSLNAAAPEALRMTEFCKIMGKVMRRPSVFRVPPIVLKIMYGEGGNEILSGQKVIPQKAAELGYKFKFEKALPAISNLLKK